MPTNSTFTQSLTIADIIEPSKSVGAHLGAKLQMFKTDERTLTDELCDMLCIWLQMQAQMKKPVLTTTQKFALTLSKTTTAKEVKNGADLELIVSCPLGSKKCLIQAKVLDPDTINLRCNSAKGWDKLRLQLVAARKEVGELAFLLIYVPGGILNGQEYGYSTYEQQDQLKSNSSTEAYFGATIIAANDLLSERGHWKNRKEKIPRNIFGQFIDGIPFWQLLMELLLCRRSSWSEHTKNSEKLSIKSYHSLTLNINEIGPDDWRSIQKSADQWLPDSNKPNDN